VEVVDSICQGVTVLQRTRQRDFGCINHGHAFAKRPTRAHSQALANLIVTLRRRRGRTFISCNSSGVALTEITRQVDDGERANRRRQVDENVELLQLGTYA
jgi:hypothetical protein